MAKKYEIEPLDDFVVVRHFKGNESKGGIAIPDVASGGYRFYVVAVGPNCKRSLHPDDEVMLAAAKGGLGFVPPDYMSMGNYMVIHESHVIARLKTKEQ